MIRVKLFLTMLISCPSLVLASDVIWSADRTALAFCYKNSETVCFVVADDAPIDVSGIEGANLGRLGHGSRSTYKNIVTFPSEWLAEKDNGHLIIFTTQAWKGGQRHTVKGPVAIEGGKYVRQ